MEEETKPSAMEEETNPKPSTTKSNIEVKQLQRYYTVLRDFMAHFHKKDEIYPPNHEFTQDELRAVSPQDLVNWMNMKLYNKEDPDEDDRPLNGSHHTLDYYKKSISYFMPKKEISWDPAEKSGNPTRSHEVNNLIKKVRDFDAEIGGAKKRKSLAAQKAMLSTTPAAAKRARESLPFDFAPVAAPQPLPMLSTGGAALQGILHRMHTQNESFIDLFGGLSSSLDVFKSTLQANNVAIMNEIANLNQMFTLPTAIPNQVVARAGAEVAGNAHHIVAMGSMPGVGTGMLDWQYVHADGIRRRVPPTWTFPHFNLQDMYILWHCGDYQNRISPMKLFGNSDVNFLGKRARMNLNEVKNLMATIDEEATRKGKVPNPTMTLNQAAGCFQAGLSGFSFSSTTPTGKQRNILRLKWSTLTKYNKTGATPTKEEQEEAETLDEAKARQEFIVSPGYKIPHDNWWYEHNDGAKRRVPSTWKFPMLGVEDIYVLWHCGDAEAKISPMKLFQASDVSVVKRSKTNLSEVRAVMTIIDLEAAKQGMILKSVMTVEEAKHCCRVGHPGLKIPLTTPDGRTRDILSMKWSSAVRLKTPTGKGKTPEDEEIEPPETEDDEVEPPETTVIVPSEKGEAPEAEETELPETEIEV